MADLEMQIDLKQTKAKLEMLEKQFKALLKVLEKEGITSSEEVDACLNEVDTDEDD